MRGINLQFDNLTNYLKKNKQLKQITTDRQSFDFVYEKVTLDCLKIVGIIFQQTIEDSSTKKSYNLLIKELKQFIEVKPIIGEQQQDDYYDNEFDEVQHYLNSRKPVQQPSVIQRGDIFKYLSQAESKQKDMAQFMGNLAKLNQKNKKTGLSNDKLKTNKNIDLQTTQQCVQTNLTALMLEGLEKRFPTIFVFQNKSNKSNQFSQQNQLDMEQKFNQIFGQFSQYKPGHLSNNGQSERNLQKDQSAQQKNIDGKQAKIDKVKQGIIDSTITSDFKKKNAIKIGSVQKTSTQKLKSTVTGTIAPAPTAVSGKVQRKSTAQTKAGKQQKSQRHVTQTHQAFSSQHQKQTTSTGTKNQVKQALAKNAPNKYDQVNNQLRANLMVNRCIIGKDQFKDMLSHMSQEDVNNLYQQIKANMILKAYQFQKFTADCQVNTIITANSTTNDNFSLKNVVISCDDDLFVQCSKQTQTSQEYSTELLQNQNSMNMLQNKSSMKKLQNQNSIGRQLIQKMNNSTKKSKLSTKANNGNNSIDEQSQGDQTNLDSQNYQNSTNHKKRLLKDMKNLQLPSLKQTNRNSQEIQAWGQDDGTGKFKRSINQKQGNLERIKTLYHDKKNKQNYTIDMCKLKRDKNRVSGHVSSFPNIHQPQYSMHESNLRNSSQQLNGCSQQTQSLNFSPTPKHFPNHPAQTNKQQQRIMKQLQKIANQKSITSNIKNICFYIQFIQSLHKRRCGEKCVHLQRFHQFLKKRNMPTRIQVNMARKDMNVNADL